MEEKGEKGERASPKSSELPEQSPGSQHGHDTQDPFSGSIKPANPIGRLWPA